MVQHSGAQKWQQCHYDAPSSEVKDTSHQDPISTKQVTLPVAIITVKTQTKTKSITIPLWNAILEILDPYASLYTASQKTDASQWLRERLFNFVASEAHTYLGPKKSRILSTWLSGNRCTQESESIIRWFIDYMFGEKSTHINLFLDKRGNWLHKHEE
jgi:hypothetical protein